MNDVVLVSFLLVLNRFLILFWSFHRLLWTSKCRLEYSREVASQVLDRFAKKFTWKQLIKMQLQNCFFTLRCGICRCYFVQTCDFYRIKEKIPANIYLFKVNNRNIGKRCEICSKLTIKTPERCQWRRSGVLIVNFENISHLFLVFLLLNLNKKMLAGKGQKSIAYKKGSGI